MLNIRFRGFYKNEEQLKKVSISSTSVKFEEPEDINMFLKNGFLMFLPLVFATSIIAGQTVFNIVLNTRCGISDIALSLIFSSVVVVLCQFIHEIIHAILFPKRTVKEIYVSKDLMSCFVYCSVPVSKIRFIIISIAPNIILGVFPLFIAVLCKNMMPLIILLPLVITGFSLIMAGMGDYYNIYNAICQVPAGAYIFNSGLHSYWYEKDANINVKPSASAKVLIVLLFMLGLIFIYFKNEICLALFFVIIMIAMLNRGLFYSVFKWLNLIGIVFAYTVLLGLV